MRDVETLSKCLAATSDEILAVASSVERVAGGKALAQKLRARAEAARAVLTPHPSSRYQMTALRMAALEELARFARPAYCQEIANAIRLEGRKTERVRSRLDYLHATGLATKTHVSINRSHRQYYAITDAGRAALARHDAPADDAREDGHGEG